MFVDLRITKLYTYINQNENIDSLYRQQLPKPDGAWFFAIF